MTQLGFLLEQGNKGGVSVRLSIFGHMVCFLNCHLPAHLEKAEQRKEDFTTILNMQQFEGHVASGILDHEYVPPGSFHSLPTPPTGSDWGLELSLQLHPSETGRVSPPGARFRC